MITDVRGVQFRFDRSPARVVSLVPSLTESLFDLGAGASVVGATDFCIYPESIRCARVGGTKNPDVQAIRDLQPDLVHMNLEENLRRHAEDIEKFTPVFVTEPKNLDDVESLFAVLGTIHHVNARAAQLIERLREQRRALRPRKFTFACAIWKKPWMWCGGDTYVSALVESAGGENVLRHRERYPEMDLDCMAAMEPQVVFLPDEPYTFTPADAADAAERTNARVIGPFPGHLFTWHGTRTILGLRFLRETL